MNSAPLLEKRRRQHDASIACRRSAEAAGQAHRPDRCGCPRFGVQGSACEWFKRHAKGCEIDSVMAVVCPQRRERAPNMRERRCHFVVLPPGRATGGPSSCERPIALPIAWHNGEPSLGNHYTSAPRARPDSSRRDTRSWWSTMPERGPRRGLASLSGDAEASIKSPENITQAVARKRRVDHPARDRRAPGWRGRIQLAVFPSENTVAAMACGMLERAFSEHGAAS